LRTEFQEGEQLSEDMLAQMGNLLHVTMLKLTIIFGLVFGVLNYFIGTSAEIILSLSLVPVCGFFLWLYNAGYKILSKVISMLAIALILSLVSLMVSPEALTPVYFIPILGGILIIFPGKEQKIGYAMAAVILSLMLFLLIGDAGVQLVTPALKSPEKLYADRVSNIIGLAIMCILEVYFVMRVGKQIQKLLAERSENLRQSNKRLTSLVHSRESMVSILSHDLRSPLTLIVSTMDLLKPGRYSPEQLEGLLEKVGSRTKNTLLMLDSLLLWSRSHLEGTAYEPEMVSLGDVRKSIQDYCELLSAEKAVQCEIQIPAEKQVRVNRIMLETILRNLVSNAFKFTSSKGKIQISFEEKDKFWIFCVSDSGKGMNAEALQNLRNGISFSTEGTDREKGHGLGIQIVRDFLQKMNAGFELDSEPGKGTSFSFRIPVLS